MRTVWGRTGTSEMMRGQGNAARRRKTREDTMASREPDLAELYPPARLAEVSAAVADAGLDALLLTPGPDLRYVTGYDAHQLERLTCLVVPATGDPVLVVPRLEQPAAQRFPGRPPWRRDHSLGRDRRPVRAGRGPAGAARQGGPVGPDVGADGAAAAGRDARGRAGAGQLCAARPAGAQEPGRGGGAAGGGRGDRPGARPGAGLAAAGPDRGSRSPPTSATRSSRPGTRGSTSRSSAPGRTAPARTTRPRAGCCSPATWWWSTSAARCRAATARTAPAPT